MENQLPSDYLVLMLHGERDVRLERRPMPALRPNEVRVRVVANTTCLSTYKEYLLGLRHSRIATLPICLGHELAGVVVEVGADRRGLFAPGERVTVQPQIVWRGETRSVGYAYEHLGGDAQYAVLGDEVIETGSFFKFTCAFYKAALAEPLSCLLSGIKEQVHTRLGSHEHTWGLVPGGNLAVLGAGGPMGIGLLLLALAEPQPPKFILATEADPERLRRLQAMFPASEQRARKTELVFVNPREQDVLALAHARTGGEMMHDVFSMTPAPAVLAQADALMGERRAISPCHCVFAGPTDKAAPAEYNPYWMHYGPRRIGASQGGTNDDIADALRMIESAALDPARMIVAVQGLDAIAETVARLPELSGKTLVYTHVRMPRVDLAADLPGAADRAAPPYDRIFRELHRLVATRGGQWSDEAEDYLLSQPGITP